MIWFCGAQLLHSNACNSYRFIYSDTILFIIRRLGQRFIVIKSEQLLDAVSGRRYQTAGAGSPYGAPDGFVNGQTGVGYALLRLVVLSRLVPHGRSAVAKTEYCARWETPKW